MNRFLICFALFLLAFSACAPQTEPTITEAVQALAACENSKGQTLDAMTKALFGTDIFTVNKEAARFSKMIDNMDAGLRDTWTNSINNDFLLDPTFMTCVRSKMPVIKKFYDSTPSQEEQKVLMDYFNKPENFTTYRMLPYLMMAAQNLPVEPKPK